ncbi:hypothetical protein H6G00_01460 [Leptolyngbya sp. FACHB-541]|uniref:hypothetical protein n=1 Tax=Leptolyngbya sp. FACHB-541 TaxID=2692810 RepID=UPI00168679F1|nr:hypothetical protein [Leptolyngbya sp. FACHB-541]MBD1995297.1 hypothetical protein [Leptolyngbya sp. FACHB-541]
MTSPSQIQTDLRKFFESQLRIDEWGLNTPDNVEDLVTPRSIGREEPATDISTSGFFAGMGSPSPVIARVTFPYMIIFRFSAAYQYEQLPRSEAQNRLLKMLAVIRTDYYCINDEIEAATATGQILTAQEKNKDWLLAYKISVTTSFQTDLEDLEQDLGYMGPKAPPSLETADGNTGIKIPFSYGDASPKTIYVAGAGQTIVTANVIIQVPFNGLNCALELGDAEMSDRLMRSDQVVPEFPAEYETNPGYTYSQSTPILLSIYPGLGCSQGSGFVLIEV